MTDIDPDIPSPREREMEQAADKLARALLPADPVAAIEAVKAKEDARRTKLLRQTRLDAKEEAEREAAQLEIRSGVFVNVGDAVVPPTPEWLGKHETRPVTVQADGQGHHARSVKTVRRVFVTPVIRAHRAGHIDERQLRACTWYADRYEQTGLDGRVAKGCFEPRIASGLMGGVAFTDRQVEAMDDMRAVRKMIRANWRKFFDLVVLNEIGVKRAERMAQCRRDSGMLTLRTCADAVADWLGL
ncbi:hypothetical protein [Sphingopyxis sp. 550A]